MTPVKTHTVKMSQFRPVGSIFDQFPRGGSPLTSLHLARQVSASHELPPTPTSVWAMTRCTSLRHEHLHRNAWGDDSRAMQIHQLVVM
jgi:hypothetical protein